MKTLKLLLIIPFYLILNLNVCAQSNFEYNKVFVRIYDLQGKKMAKGKILSISDTEVQLNRKSNSEKIPVSSIGTIKTKHSGGHNVLVGAAAGAAPLAILGVTTADPDAFFGYSEGEGALTGLVVGSAAGAAIGGISILFKKSETFEINGDAAKWQAFKESVFQ